MPVSIVGRWEQPAVAGRYGMFEPMTRSRNPVSHRDWLAVFSRYRVEMALLHVDRDADLLEALSSGGKWRIDSQEEGLVIVSRQPGGG